MIAKRKECQQVSTETGRRAKQHRALAPASSPLQSPNPRARKSTYYIRTPPDMNKTSGYACATARAHMYTWQYNLCFNASGRHDGALYDTQHAISFNAARRACTRVHVNMLRARQSPTLCCIGLHGPGIRFAYKQVHTWRQYERRMPIEWMIQRVRFCNEEPHSPAALIGHCARTCSTPPRPLAFGCHWAHPQSPLLPCTPAHASPCSAHVR